MRKNQLFVLACLIALLPLNLSAAPKYNKKIPAWLNEALTLPSPPVEKGEEKYNTGLITLWDEGHYHLLPNAKLITSYRTAIKILDTKARNKAIANLKYNQKSEKIISFKAWTIDEKNKVHEYKRSDKVDRPNNSNGHIYEESRIKTIDGSERTHENCIFAYEYTTEKKTIYLPNFWYFHSDNPVALSKLTIETPPDWTLKATPFYGAPNGQKDENTMSWEMKSLEAIKDEPYAPSSSLKRACINIYTIPPQNSKFYNKVLKNDNWANLITYTAETMDPMAKTTNEVASKAKELTQNLSSQWEKIQAIGNYTKRLTYAGISMNLSKGGGYTPRPANETLKVGYGDCKDKATLMRSLLSSVGIDSHAVVVNSRDNDRVNPEAPSTYYFNHCIAAVEVDESIDSPAVIENEELGRLLFIDATSDITPIGELPINEQGGLVIVGREDLDSLVRLPQSDAHDNRKQHSIEAKILPNGTLLSIVDTQYFGKEANREREELMNNDEDDYKKEIKRRYIKGYTQTKVQIDQIEDNCDTDRSFHTKVICGIPEYAKNMRGEFLVFKPCLLDRVQGHPFKRKERTLPIRFQPKMLENETRIILPEGYTIDETIEDTVIEREFASYHSSIQVEGQNLYYKRQFILNGKTMPAESYEDIKQFYKEVVQADNAPITLARNR